MVTVFQNPVNINGGSIKKIAILREADVILNKVLVLAPFNEEKMIGFVRGMSASGPRDITGDY
jgi:hypothetical protein